MADGTPPTKKALDRDVNRIGDSFIFPPRVIDDIHIKSELGRYRMRGFSLFKKIPHWDDLTFLPGTLTRFVIEGYREKCDTRTLIGPRAKRPLDLDIPVYITGMSFGALSYEAKTALARGATMAGTATCSGEGGMIPDERRYSSKWFYQCIQSRYGFNPHHLVLADGCEFFIGQGCKVGLGGHLMGQKVTDQVAEMRSLPAGIDQRSPARHPDWLGPDDLALKIQEIREATDWQIPIQLKLGAARVYDDVRMAVKCDPDSIYIDGMEGGTGAGPHLATEDTGVPGMAAIRQARKAIDDLGKRGEISLVYAGGIRNGADMAKAIALGRGRHRHRPLGDDGLELQQGHPRGELPRGDRCRTGLLLPLPHREMPGGRGDAGPGLAPAARPRRGGRARVQLPPHTHHRGAAFRPCLRQDQPSFARARGPRGLDDGGQRDGGRAACGHQPYGWRRRLSSPVIAWIMSTDLAEIADMLRRSIEPPDESDRIAVLCETGDDESFFLGTRAAYVALVCSLLDFLARDDPPREMWCGVKLQESDRLRMMETLAYVTAHNAYIAANKDDYETVRSYLTGMRYDALMGGK